MGSGTGLIVATAGHVDHGKTALIKQLTGVDTDRLEEEKRRGLSINLGFAYRSVEGDTTLGFIDVPGHTRFINTMITGVSGIDLGMLVIAADDGIMPQTLEHLDVLRLLGITQCLVVISKIDRVEPERVTAVADAARKLLGEDYCCAAFPVSNSSGEGVAALQQYLDKRAVTHRQRSSAGNFRLSVDRAFLLKGIGLVLTGTVISGAVAVGDELQLLPQGVSVRVRSLRVQDHDAQRGRAGDRCAMNISGSIQKDQVKHGDVLVCGKEIPLCERFDAAVALLPHAPFAIKHLSPVKVHIGARRMPARLYLIGDTTANRLQPGEEALAQLILEQPLPCCRGDRFLLRDDSESATLGGGIILDPLAPRSGKAQAGRLRYLHAMAKDTPVEALQDLLDGARSPIDLTSFCRAWNLRPDERQALLSSVAARKFAFEGVDYALPEQAWTLMTATLLERVQSWHRNNPEQPGIKATALQESQGKSASSGVFRAVLAGLLRQGKLSLASGMVQTPGYRPSVPGAEQAGWNKLKRALDARGLRLPLVSELTAATGMTKELALACLQSATRRGLAFKLNDNRYALPRHLAEYAVLLQELADNGEDITVINFKQHIKSGRKLAIEILEHFDAVGFTRRRAESRIICQSDLPASLYAT
jgi:selenocysteine-specific elongation factor